MNSPLVSIIVAAYNAEHYLPRCLDSLSGQTYRNIEIIIVNDASTDNTQDIIDHYSQRDSRIIALKQEKNGGAQVARNRGIKISKGEFLTMVDADDTISADAIELSVKDMMENDDVDFVTYSIDQIYVNEDNDKKQYTHKPFIVNPKVPTLMTGDEACYWSMQWDMPGLGMSRSPLEQSIVVDGSKGQYGDETATHLMYAKARKVKLGKGVYHYYHVPTSYTNKISIKRFEILECRLDLISKLKEAGVDGKTILRLEPRRWREFIDMCHLYWKYKGMFSAEEQLQIHKRLSKTYSTFKFAHLPLTTTLKPRFMMLPTFELFYKQVSTVWKWHLSNITE